MIVESMRVKLIAIISIRVLIKLVKVAKVHSTRLTLEKSVGAVTTCPAYRAIISLIHLGVTPDLIIAIVTTTSARSLRRLSNGIDCVRLIRMVRIVARLLVIVNVLH